MTPGEDHVGEVVLDGDVPTTAFVSLPTAALAARAVRELDGTVFRQEAEEEEEGEESEVGESTIVVFPDWRIVDRQQSVVLDGVNSECTILEIKKAFGPELLTQIYRIEREPDEPKSARVFFSSTEAMNFVIRNEVVVVGEGTPHRAQATVFGPDLLSQQYGPAAPPQELQHRPDYDTLQARYASQLSQLAEMGFLMIHQNIDVLWRCGGSVERALQILI